MKLFEEFDNKDYFMVTWIEGGDEIHMVIVDMQYYDNACELLPSYLDDSYDNFLEFIYEHQQGRELDIQTHCVEDFPFYGINIVKVIHAVII